MKFLHAVAIIALSVPAALLAATADDASLFHCNDGTAQKDATGTWRCPDGSLAHPTFGALRHYSTMVAISTGYPPQLSVGEGTSGHNLIRTPSVEDITRSITGTLRPY
ncbi:hypothetical protein [Paraburkholderia sp. J10-1]|uniref:hypothetical protein n=1 Tax=Paraburkholderia sp. J10-1 TaxID=2805430 RepID=UPI002AB70EC5|nr:hypothetical protein [Paraburkholderia sp. J10-1]